MRFVPIFIRGNGLSDAEIAENERHVREATERWNKMMQDNPGLRERYETALRDSSEKIRKRTVDTG